MAPAQAAASSSSVMQLSTFTKVTSIPRNQKMSDMKVTVKLAVPEMAVPHHAAVDIVAVIDVSGSMKDQVPGSNKNMLDLVKEAMENVVENLAGADNRLAIVAFDNSIKKTQDLQRMTGEGQRKSLDMVKSLAPQGRTNFAKALERAPQFLNARSVEEKNCLAFIIFFSDGDAGLKAENINPNYPIHAFGFSAAKPEALELMANVNSGSYTLIDKDHLNKIPENACGVTVTKVEPENAATVVGDSFKCNITPDGRAGEIFLGALSSGKVREVIVHLDVPKGGIGAGADDDEWKLVAFGSNYKQDGKIVEGNNCIVAVVRPSCKELDWIEERLKYWCKVKVDLSAMYDKAETEAEKPKCGKVTEALREASDEAIDLAMHRDIYTAVLHAIKMRQCSGDKA
uniref:VWFA domain-containing protein n=1 Tax=Leersia perrieri TaxID=77586 RepID=A0A0D9XR44_9ORYZ